MFSPSVSNSLQQYDTFRELWRRRGSLGRAAAKYAQGTGDYAFAVQEMLRVHHEWPIPGLWEALRGAESDEPEAQQAIREVLAEQRQDYLRGRRSPFATLAALQRDVIGWLRRPELGLPGEELEVVVTEACYKNLVLAGRMLLEQSAMRECLYQLGSDRTADEAMVTLLRRASDRVLFDLDSRLEGGVLLEEAFAVEILLESLES